MGVFGGGSSPLHCRAVTKTYFSGIHLGNVINWFCNVASLLIGLGASQLANNTEIYQKKTGLQKDMFCEFNFVMHYRITIQNRVGI